MELKLLSKLILHQQLTIEDTIDLNDVEVESLNKETKEITLKGDSNIKEILAKTASE